MTDQKLYWLLLDCKTIVDAAGVKSTSNQLAVAIKELEDDFRRQIRSNEIILKAVNQALTDDPNSSITKIDVIATEEGRQ